MKILVFSHFYYPEVGAASIRTQYFVKVLREAGHEVKIVTPKPNYPSAKKYEGFDKCCKFDRENNVVYLPLYLPSKHSLIGRGLTYISYFLVSFFYVLFDSFRYDVILTSSPPVTTSLAAVIVAKLRRKKVVLDIRDLWPDIGIELGIIKNSFIIYLLQKIVNFQVRKASKIVVPLESFVERIKDKGAKSEIRIIFNGADTSIYSPLSESEKIEIRNKYSLPLEKKIAVYFGFFNFGMNDVDTLATAIEKTAEKKDALHYLFIGDGVKRKEFEEKISGRVNYTFLQPLAAKELSKVIASCDLSVIPLKKVKGSTGGFIPVKCLESWAAGLPVLLATERNSKIEKIFSESGGGKIIPPGNADTLARELMTMLFSDELPRMGEKGRKFVEENFDRTKQSAKIVEIIDSV
jgi:glycosyltransferase involved in cell wall biosynthesis